MTEQRKNRVKKKIQESRGRLLSTMPFFGLLLMYLKFVAVPGMKKISTNGKCIYFSPDFLEKLYEKEIDYILCHQILHIVCGHIWRDRDLSGDDYHFACDIFLNLILEDYGYDEEKYPHLGYIYRKMSGSIDFRDKTPLEIRDWLPYSLKVFDEPTRSKFIKDSEYWWDFKDDDGNAGEIIIDLPEITGRLNDGQGGAFGGADASGDFDNGDMQNWKDRAMALATSLFNEEDEGNADQVPEFIQRMITKMKQPYKTKKMFSDYCIGVGVAPCFASVGLMPIDPQRCEAGLALKFDGFYMNYTGNEDLSVVEEPVAEDEDYRAFCVEQIIAGYLDGDFSKIYDKFDENIQLHSMWVLEPKVGKSEIIDYYNGKGESLRKSRTKMVGNCVITTDEVVKKNGNVGLFTPSGQVAALIGQEINGQTNWVFIMPKFNDENKIVEISINDPSFFNFTNYYAYD